MVSIVIPDEKLLGFATAFSDERLREVIFCLQDGPASEAVMQEFLKVEAKDLRATRSAASGSSSCAASPAASQAPST